jgi:hypothetical protein
MTMMTPIEVDDCDEPYLDSSSEDDLFSSASISDSICNQREQKNRKKRAPTNRRHRRERHQENMPKCEYGIRIYPFSLTIKPFSN